MKKVHTSENPTDMLNKPLPITKFEHCLDLVSIACDCRLGLCPSGHHSSECFGSVQELVLNFGPRWRLLGIWSKIF